MVKATSNTTYDNVNTPPLKKISDRIKSKVFDLFAAPMALRIGFPNRLKL